MHMVYLREHEQKTLLALKKLDGRGDVEKIAEVSGLAHAAVMRAVLTLKEKKLIKVHEKKQRIVTLNEEGEHHAKKGLPERRLIDSLIKLGGKAPTEKVAKDARLDKKFIPIALGWLQRKDWAKIEEKTRVLKALLLQKN